MSTLKNRAWWAHRQGLDGRLSGEEPANVLATTGWARSVGGANPYIQLFSRAGTNRAEADAAVASLAIHELPAARGCTYVVPAADYALALTVGGPPEGEVRRAAQLGVPRAEIDRLCAALLAAMGDEPLEPKELTDRVGDAARSLGDEGRKKGMATTLPVGLGLLQAAGEIRRIPVDGRLDQQRYGYVRWTPSPLAANPLDAAAARTELARRYFAWTGGATLKNFRWFSAFSAKHAKAAVEPLGLVRIDADLLALPEDAAAYADFAPPQAPSYAVVAGIDGITLLRRDLATLVDLAELPAEHSLGGLADLPSHGIFDRGELVGMWEFDPDEAEIVWLSFRPADDALLAKIARTETFIREQLGDARSFSLDSPASRRPRLEELRAAAKRGLAG